MSYIAIGKNYLVTLSGILGESVGCFSFVYSLRINCSLRDVSVPFGKVELSDTPRTVATLKDELSFRLHSHIGCPGPDHVTEPPLLSSSLHQALGRAMTCDCHSARQSATSNILR